MFIRVSDSLAPATLLRGLAFTSTTSDLYETVIAPDTVVIDGNQNYDGSHPEPLGSPGYMEAEGKEREKMACSPALWLHSTLPHPEFWNIVNNPNLFNVFISLELFLK